VQQVQALLAPDGGFGQTPQVNLMPALVLDMCHLASVSLCIEKLIQSLLMRRMNPTCQRQSQLCGPSVAMIQAAHHLVPQFPSNLRHLFTNLMRLEALSVVLLSCR